MNTKKYRNNFFVSLAGLVLAACTAAGGADPDEDAGMAPVDPVFQVVAQGSTSNITLPRQLVIVRQADWETLWRIHTNGQRTRRPRINFAQDMVIAVFAGQQPSGGYAVKIEKLKINDEILDVYVSFHEPGPTDKVSLALTQPYYIVSTPRYFGKVRFRYLDSE